MGTIFAMLSSSVLVEVEAPRGFVVLMVVEEGMGMARTRSESSLHEVETSSGVNPKS